MNCAQRCELTVAGRLAGSMEEAIRSRFTVVSVRSAERTVLTVAADQAAVRAMMMMLWDTGHEVLAMSIT